MTWNDPKVEICIGSLVSLLVVVHSALCPNDSFWQICLKLVNVFFILPLCALLVFNGTCQLLNIESQCFEFGLAVAYFVKTVAYGC